MILKGKPKPKPSLKIFSCYIEDVICFMLYTCSLLLVGYNIFHFIFYYTLAFKKPKHTKYKTQGVDFCLTTYAVPESLKLIHVHHNFLVRTEDG